MMFNFVVYLTGLSDEIMLVNITVFLGVSLRMFPEEIIVAFESV